MVLTFVDVDVDVDVGSQSVGVFFVCLCCLVCLASTVVALLCFALRDVISPIDDSFFC